MYICICIYIPKYNLLSPYNVTWMYVFRDNVWHWTTNWFIGRTTSPVPRFTVAYSSCEKLRCLGLFPTQLGMLISISLVQLMFGWLCW